MADLCATKYGEVYQLLVEDWIGSMSESGSGSWAAGIRAGDAGDLGIRDPVG